MNKEEKELLVKVLCEMLPHKVRCKCVNGLGGGKTDKGVLKYIGNCNGVISNYYEDIPIDSGFVNNVFYPIENIKPYLRPMSSMSEDEMVDYGRIKLSSDKNYAFSDYRKTGKGFVNIHTVNRKTGEESYMFQVNGRTMLYDGYVGIDWLNAHHFDYRGLIEKGLAVEAPEGMYN